MNPSHQIAEHLEAARLKLASAEKAHTEASERVAAVEKRITDARARQADITARRLAGEATEAETAELNALGYDLEALAVITQKAGSDADATRTALESARNRVAQAEAAWERHRAEAKIDALRGRAAHLEGLLVDCLAELAATAHGAGVGHFREVWQPSPALETAMGHSRLETIQSLRRAA